MGFLGGALIFTVSYQCSVRSTIVYYANVNLFLTHIKFKSKRFKATYIDKKLQKNFCRNPLQSM
jgi:hypothetical protein